MPHKNIEDRRRYRMKYYYANHSKSLSARRMYNWKVLGISITEKERCNLLEKQDHKCAICEKHESTFKRGLAVDHDHLTGKVRGLLCFTCNRYLISMFEKYSHLIPKIEKYLKESASC